MDKTAPTQTTCRSACARWRKDHHRLINSIFITGYKADVMDEFLKTRTVLQSNPQGLGQAISLALPYASDNEPLLIILGDTIFDADISSLSNAETNILYTYKVAAPRRFGVAVTDANGNISKLVEKPQEFVSDEAIVGIYYIKDVKELKATLKHLMDNDIRTKGEFQLTDALQMMTEQGCKFQIWAARHNSAVALYVVGPFRRQGDAPPLTTRSLLRNMGEGNAAKVCAPRGQMRLRHICLHSVIPSYAQVRTCRDARWGHDHCRNGERLSNPLIRKSSVSYKGVMKRTFGLCIF